MSLITILASLIVRALLFVRCCRASVSLVVRLLGLLLATRFGRVLEHLSIKFSSSSWPFGASQVDLALKGWG